MEEKGSDVNLAAHLLNDAWKNAFEAAAVISNDTDLVTPIQMVSVERRKPVFVVCPGRWQMAPDLEKVASYKRHIHRKMLAAAQFPDPIPGTTISIFTPRFAAATSSLRTKSSGKKYAFSIRKVFWDEAIPSKYIKSRFS